MAPTYRHAPMNLTRNLRWLAGTLLLIAAPNAADAQKVAPTIDVRSIVAAEAASGFAADTLTPPRASWDHRNWGSLTESDRVLSSGARYDLWRLNVWNNEHVWVTVRSRDFDTFTAILNPENRSISVENDDFESTSTDSRISMRSRGGGEYLILVTSYGPAERGRYSIDVQRAPSTP
ncbi:MAG TPA: hypothetical protein PK788_06080 [Gemmatimonadaceae bacterium]|nr:hypothetical protein [Gemmatimonadaceae bacterium]HRQ77309.1 hypothetical protein [Gemmatimonadaceae bacterium]